jgi:hypothetical protein|tara:strand:+ start:432 stop:611 length:180 start_codon:yes stop_codon:yes gene_type:complete
VRTIEPVSFARLMQLPTAIRDELLEIAGSTQIPDRQLLDMISTHRAASTATATTAKCTR